MRNGNQFNFINRWIGEFLLKQKKIVHTADK